MSDEQGELNYDPDEHYRGSDPWTSKAAAYKVNPGSVAWSVLKIHYNNPSGLNDDELTNLDYRLVGRPSSMRKRRSDLYNNGYLADSGTVRDSNNKRASVVWVITKKGISTIEAHEPGR